MSSVQLGSDTTGRVVVEWHKVAPHYRVVADATSKGYATDKRAVAAAKRLCRKLGLTFRLTPPPYAREFPDFPAADLPRIPPGFLDTSWHNDASPSFTDHARHLLLWVNYRDPAKREWAEDGGRFILLAGIDPDPQTTLYEGDDWDACLDCILAARFAATLREWLTPQEFDTMRQRNANNPPEICASHDFCDANMAMDAAWRATIDPAGVDADDEAQARRWNDAWTFAKQMWL